MPNLTRDDFAKLLELKAEFEVLKARVDSLMAYISSEPRILHVDDLAEDRVNLADLPQIAGEISPAPIGRKRGRPKGSKNGKVHAKTP